SSRPAATRRCSTSASAWAMSRRRRPRLTPGSRSTCAAAAAVRASCRNPSTSERTTLSARAGVVPRQPQVPPRARLGAYRRGRSLARPDSPGRAGRARCAARRPCLSRPAREHVSFLSLTESDREAMLAAIGVDSTDELFRDIPPAMLLGRELDLEPPLTEAEL